jgi:hypothetical protein
VKPFSRGFAVFGLIACLQATNVACSSRITPAETPVPPSSDPPPQPTSTVDLPAPPPATTAPGPETGAGDCALIAEPGDPITTVALSDPIDASNAPRPSNESERVLFRQLYDTLVRIDCQGRVAAGLAASWRLDEDGRTWIVTLRENARFSDGTPVTAADVRASWTRAGMGDELLPTVSRLVQSVTPVDDHALAITLSNQRADVPTALAHADLAIAKPVGNSPWPLGTRSRRIAPAGHTPLATAAAVIAVTRDNLSTLRFLVAPGDPRDLLDDGIDLLLTRDPAAVDYAATLPHFQSVALAWQRIYALLTPGRSRSSPSISEDARQALAGDAIRGEAQGARGPFWWQMMPACEVSPISPPDQRVPTPRIVYDASDAAARDLAERFVGLARATGPAAAAWLDMLLPDRPRRRYERATGLTGDALTSARRRGIDAAYVMSLDRRPIDPCRDLQALLDGARWLDPETIVPLVETRRQAIVRRGRSGVTAEWDGGLLIADGNASR